MDRKIEISRKIEEIEYKIKDDLEILETLKNELKELELMELKLKLKDKIDKLSIVLYDMGFTNYIVENNRLIFDDGQEKFPIIILSLDDINGIYYGEREIEISIKMHSSKLVMSKNSWYYY